MDIDPKALQEVSRRAAAAAALTGAGAGAAAAPTAAAGQPAPERNRAAEEAAVRQRDAFKAQYSGYCVINCANKDFEPLKCQVPNLRILPAFFRTHAEAKEFVARVMATPGVRAMPIVVEANEPFLIAATEELTQAWHCKPKINRILRRHIVAQARAKDELSARVSSLPTNPDWANGARSAPVEEPQLTEEEQRKIRAEVEAKATSAYVRRMRYLQTPAEQRDGVMPTLPSMLTEEEMADLRAASAAQAEQLKAAAAGASAGAGGEGPGPGPLLSREEVPAHWFATGPEETEVSGSCVRDWPAHLVVQGAQYAVISVIDDDDTLADDPVHGPIAAGREPLIVIFGGFHGSVADARAHIDTHLSKWCTELTLEVVDTAQWLYPTEVHPDAVQTEYRTHSAEGAVELNRIMQHRIDEQKRTAEAKATYGDSMRVLTVNEVPSLEEAARQLEPSARILNVQELMQGEELVTASAATATMEFDDDLPDLEHVEDVHIAAAEAAAAAAAAAAAGEDQVGNSWDTLPSL